MGADFDMDDGQPMHIRGADIPGLAGIAASVRRSGHCSDVPLQWHPGLCKQPRRSAPVSIVWLGRCSYAENVAAALIYRPLLYGEQRGVCLQHEPTPHAAARRSSDVRRTLSLDEQRVAKVLNGVHEDDLGAMQHVAMDLVNQVRTCSHRTPACTVRWSLDRRLAA